MVYVCRMPTIGGMVAESQEFIRDNADNIKKVRKSSIPISVEFTDGNIYLFMTIEYYERRYKIGRHKGIDHMTI